MRLQFNIGPPLGPQQLSVMCVTFWMSFFVPMIVILQFLWIERTNFDNAFTCWAVYIKVHESNLKQSKIMILCPQLPGKWRYVCHPSCVMCVTSLNSAFKTRRLRFHCGFQTTELGHNKDLDQRLGPVWYNSAMWCLMIEMSQRCGFAFITHSNGL